MGAKITEALSRNCPVLKIYRTNCQLIMSEIYEYQSYLEANGIKVFVVKPG
jgi:hypothetical protein